MTIKKRETNYCIHCGKPTVYKGVDERMDQIFWCNYCQVHILSETPDHLAENMYRIYLKSQRKVKQQIKINDIEFVSPDGSGEMTFRTDKNQKKDIMDKRIKDRLISSFGGSCNYEDEKVITIPLDKVCYYKTMCGNHTKGLGNMVVDYLKGKGVKKVYAILFNGDISGAIINMTEEDGYAFEDIVEETGNSLRVDSCSVMGKDWSSYESE